MSQLPPIDLHAHIESDIDPRELPPLRAAVFAVTRSLDEAHTAVRRKDRMTVWGVGCHPGLVGAQRAFNADVFSELLERTPLAGEIGLDGKSRVPMETQVATFRAALQVLRDKPRISSIHSYAASAEVVELVAEVQTPGTVLHWWLGTPEQTAKAVELGCYFSVNAAMIRRSDLIASLPIDRLLTETDHPFGDRSTGKHRRPGLVTNVELAIAQAHNLSSESIRVQLWRNFRGLCQWARVGSLLPREMRRHLASI